MEPVQETVTNIPTPSRTIRVTHNGDYTVSINHGVTQAENGRRFLTFSTIDEAVIAYTELRAAEVKASYLTYSLFVKSQEEHSEDTLKAQVLGLVPNANVTYLRVDENKHTGKVVVDLLTDYQMIKSSSGDSLRFFHFDPKRVRPRRDNESSGVQRVPRYQRDQGDQSSRPRRDNDSGYQRVQGGRGGQGRQGGRGEQRVQGGRGEQRVQGAQGGRNTNSV
jgi:hypothetical protein